MLPKDKNGVVDPKLKVYGTKNIRVVDLSIVPLQFAAHTQGTPFLGA
jgi:choline dehydrogenase-like flavoprotein